jgi:predicted nucleic acid-binding protein
MQKIMLDTMEYDKLLATLDSYHRLLRLLSSGRIELLTTHIQRDQIRAAPDHPKKASLLEIFAKARIIGTRGIVFDVSRFDQAKFGSDEDHDIIKRAKDAKDGLIAATASSGADTLVTDDKNFTKRLRKAHIECEVIDFTSFEKRLADIGSSFDT